MYELIALKLDQTDGSSLPQYKGMIFKRRDISYDPLIIEQTYAPKVDIILGYVLSIIVNHLITSKFYKSLIKPKTNSSSVG
jgi:hypothetical protein